MLLIINTNQTKQTIQLIVPLLNKSGLEFTSHPIQTIQAKYETLFIKKLLPDTNWSN